MEKEVIFLIGPPGVGKSTWLDQAGLYRHVVCSTDDIFERKGAELGMGYNDAFKHFPFKDVECEFKDRIRAAVAAGESVVIDRTNMTANGRRKLLDMFPNTYHRVAYVFNFSDVEEVKRRLLKREVETGKAISLGILMQMINSYVEPTKSEFNEINYVK